MGEVELMGGTGSVLEHERRMDHAGVSYAEAIRTIWPLGVIDMRHLRKASGPPSPCQVAER